MPRPNTASRRCRFILGSMPVDVIHDIGSHPPCGSLGLAGIHDEGRRPHDASYRGHPRAVCRRLAPGRLRGLVALLVRPHGGMAFVHTPAHLSQGVPAVAWERYKQAFRTACIRYMARRRCGQTRCLPALRGGISRHCAPLLPLPHDGAGTPRALSRRGALTPRVATFCELSRLARERLGPGCPAAPTTPCGRWVGSMDFAFQEQCPRMVGHDVGA